MSLAAKASQQVYRSIITECAYRFFGLIRAVFLPLYKTDPLRFIRTLFVRLMLVFILLLNSLISLIGHLIDELLYHGYRSVKPARPLFIVGAPRSGTTTLYHLLAHDTRFSTLKTWECLFAPSVTQKKFWLCLARLDRKAGGYLGAGLMRSFDAMSGMISGRHPVRLNAPAEDYLLLLADLRCFALVLVFPEAHWLWRQARHDEIKPDATLFAWHHRCLQKHLYVFGTDKVLLSKNPAFAGSVHELATLYPDARFLISTRDSILSSMSLISVVRPVLVWLHGTRGAAEVCQRLTACQQFYYENLEQFTTGVGQKMSIYEVPLWRLSREKSQLVAEIAKFSTTLRMRSVQSEIEVSDSPVTSFNSEVVSMQLFQLEERFNRWRHQTCYRI